MRKKMNAYLQLFYLEYFTFQGQDVRFIDKISLRRSWQLWAFVRASSREGHSPQHQFDRYFTVNAGNLKDFCIFV